ncbi:flavodoxin family protein [Candidatus Fermentibacteria bacterium]|nr:flavodoxin family protein [Candidatus Fermentibacteria bacterium]
MPIERILVVNGSPRGNNSNTRVMIDEFLKGAGKAGADSEIVTLAEKQIEHCLGCFFCWTRTPGECVLDDDMEDLLPKLDTDLLVFATPLYVDNVTGLTKNFMDRMIPLLDPHIGIDEGGECAHDMRSGRSPLIAVVSNCGFAGMSHFQVLRLLFRRVARNLRSKVVAEIYRDMGGLLTARSILLKPLRASYKKNLRKAGREVVENGGISDITQHKLQRPLIPRKKYVEAVNKQFDKTLSKLEESRPEEE